MIRDDLQKLTSEIERVAQKEKEFRDFKTREELNEKFRSNVLRLQGLCQNIKIANEVTQFLPEEATGKKLKVLIEKLKKYDAQNPVSSKELENIEKILKNSQQNIKDQWKVYFGGLCNSKLNTLEVLKVTGNVQIIPLIDRINDGREWQTKSELGAEELLIKSSQQSNPLADSARSRRVNMMEALDRAEQLIRDMNFNSSVHQFLLKMQKSTATLLDLDAEVWDWIQKNDLKSKIHISFKPR